MTNAAAPLPLSVLTSLPLPGEAAAQLAMPGADPQSMAETADFSAILAAMPASMTPSTAEAGPALTTETPLPEARQASVVTAPTLPDNGKILPLALPRAATPALLGGQFGEEPSETNAPPFAASPEPARAEQATSEQVAAMGLPVVPIALVPATASLPPAPPAGAAGGALPAVVPPARPGRSAPPARLALQMTAEAARPRSTPGPSEALPPGPLASPLATPEQRTPPAQRAATPLLPQEASERPVAQPVTAIVLRASADRPPRDELPVASALPVALGAPPPPVTTTGPASPLPTPHDFAALVDRLAAAREAVQPQAVSVALSHADFGPVRIDFRHEDGALNVALASADPDFARAIGAAPPVQPVAPSSEAAQSSPRSAEPRQQDAGGSSARGHGQADRRDDRAPHGNPSPHRPSSHPGHHAPGIFA